MRAASPRPSRDLPSSGMAVSPELITFDAFSTRTGSHFAGKRYVTAPVPPSRRARLLVGGRGAAGMRGAREQFLLALNDLGREPQIGFAADAFEVVDQHRLAVGRRLRHPHIARDDGVVDLLAAVLAHVGDDLVGE